MRRRVLRAHCEAVLKYANDIFILLDVDGHIVEANDRAVEATGYSRDELLDMHASQLRSPQARAEMDRQWQHGKHGAVFETEFQRKDGSIFPVEISARVIEVEGRRFRQGTIRDISERKQTEEAVRASRDLLLSVVENAPIRVFWKDRDLRYLGCNSAFARDAGMSRPHDLYGKDDFQMGWREQAEQYREDDRKVMTSGEAKLGFEEQQTTPDGRIVWLRTSKVPLRDADGNITGLLGIYEDISTQKQAQEALGRLDRARRTLSACNRSLVHSASEEELWQGVCRAIVEDGGYLLAWVGYAQQDETKSVKTMGLHAVKPGYAEHIHVSWDDVPEGRGPTGTAIRTGKTQYTQNIGANPAMQPWRETALSYGYQASIALPLREDGQTFGALTIYAAEPDAFDEDELSLLEEMAEDLGYGIHMLRIGIERDQSRAEQQRVLEQLETGLEETVQAIAATVESRDQYTAGHQRRVGGLATAIAREMGLSEQQVKGIHLAADIHDLGKIHIPAEILSKPGKLNEIEYRLVQTHPQAGYDILKDVSFPWPIAEIILQHHEKMDGSGYPRGLAGGQILLEARIICVADVVEAMSSHRPYRASLGLERALNEIERNRGVLYDADVVDACLRLFREKGYVLKA